MRLERPMPPCSRCAPSSKSAPHMIRASQAASNEKQRRKIGGGTAGVKGEGSISLAGIGTLSFVLPPTHPYAVCGCAIFDRSDGEESSARGAGGDQERRSEFSYARPASDPANECTVFIRLG